MARDDRHDIDEIIAQVASQLPDVSVRQLQVKHKGVDDDGLWFFKRAGNPLEVQLESSTGDCPFLVESNADNSRRNASSIDEATAILKGLFRC